MCAHQAAPHPLAESVSFFPEMDAHPLLDAAELRTVGAVDEVLRRRRPSHVLPERTAVLRTPDGALRLELRHAETSTRLAIEIAGGAVTLRWTGGAVTGPWGPEIERTLVAFLFGHDELVMQLRWGTVHTIDTFVWDGPDDPARLVSHRLVPGPSPAIVRRIPGTSQVERMSLSFDRAEALGPSSRGGSVDATR